MDTESDERMSECVKPDAANSAFDAVSKKTQLMWLYVGNLDANVCMLELYAAFHKYGVKKKWIHIVSKLGKTFAYVKVRVTQQQIAELEHGSLFLAGSPPKQLTVRRAIRRAIFRKARRISFEKYLLARSQNAKEVDNALECAPSNAAETSPPSSIRDEVDKPKQAEDRSSGSNAETTFNINYLPDVPLLKIFSYLSDRDRIRCERVCKYWFELLLKAWQSMRSLDYTKLSEAVVCDDSMVARASESAEISLRKLRSVLDRCSTDVLRQFELVNSKTETAGTDRNQRTRHSVFGDAHLALLGSFDQLVELNLTRTNVTNRGLCVLASRCTKLQRVTLAGCTDVGERGLWFLLAKQRHLSYLDISLCDRVTGNCFAKLAKNKLVEVNAEACGKLRDAGFRQLCARSGARLQRVSIRGCVSLTDDALAALAQLCPNVQRLSLHVSSPRITQIGLSLIPKLTKLTCLVLSISVLGGVTNEILRRICRNCALRHLQVELCDAKTDAEANEAVASWRSALEDLHIENLHVSSNSGAAV